jgi:hypothetical protein
MARRRARLLEQERDTGPRLARVERQAEGRDRDADPRARRLLGLQSRAGNQAVSTMVVQRDEAQPADTKKKSAVGTLTMDGVRAPLDVAQLTLASDSLSVTLELGSGVEDLIRIERANEPIEHALLETNNGFSVAMTNVRIAALEFSRPDREGGAHGSREDTIELVKVKLVFETAKRKTKPRENAPRDDWTQG